jgi:hypothetical protein
VQSTAITVPFTQSFGLHTANSCGVHFCQMIGTPTRAEVPTWQTGLAQAWEWHPIKLCDIHNQQLLLGAEFRLKDLEVVHFVIEQAVAATWCWAWLCAWCAPLVHMWVTTAAGAAAGGSASYQ